MLDRETGSALRIACAVVVAVALWVVVPAVGATVHGPWNADVLQGGPGLQAPIPDGAPVLDAKGDWSAYAWVYPGRASQARQLLAGFGDPAGAARYFLLDHGRLGFWWGGSATTSSRAAVSAGHWHFVAAVSDGRGFSLYLDGERVASASAPQVAVAAKMAIAPVAPWPGDEHFGGKVAGFTVQDGALDSRQLAAMAKRPPDPSLTRFADASPHWPVQTKQMAGQVEPQPPASLPKSRAPFSAPYAKPPGDRVALKPDGVDRWELGRWQLASAPDLDSAGGAALSSPDYTAGKPWMAATVPGTVLTTLIDRGVYPDPAYGLNNMAIPESLHQHDWWYRTTFALPAELAGQPLRLTFDGINYSAEVWINGQRAGQVEGAFIRGQFDVTGLLRPGKDNAIAVRVSPPPNPGVPHEQSITAGPGPNGGMEALDGPTFIANEGWDWIPAIRDRDTGLWQKVVLSAAGPVRIGDTHVVTRLPDADHHQADIDVDVPLENAGSAPVQGQLHIAFGDVAVDKAVTVPPGGTTVKLRPSDFPALRVQHPHLWWPNGYGEPYLYDMKVSFATDGKTSDQSQFQFGIRQISYELSLFDQQGSLRRVLVTPDMTSAPGERLVDVSHKGIRETPDAWAYSLLPAAEHSPAVTELTDKRLAPYLILRVNGVRIAVKGGSWGTDDFLKRVSRERLEPYFKLQRDAHVNVVRNWVGQSTEPVFYELADKYGLLVFNDFWQSTQDYNLEPQDDALFLRNAADTIKRYRNHPSIALWFGRNEGVPQPLLNQRLDTLIADLDGTRLYMPSSNRINLWNSGPYSYQPPAAYFTTLAKGFAVEVGTPSFPTLEAFEAMMPKADQWPISDSWAYHDWHQSGNGDVGSFMDAMRTGFGEATSLADFERKAQMMNYVSYRAIFEGMNAGLWTQNSGRLLWMSHPAWPSTTWQIYSSDYDTQASYYGVKEASEPVHVQMNLPDHRIVVVNNTAAPLHGLTVSAHVFAPDGAGHRELATGNATLDARAIAVTPVTMTTADIGRLSNQHGLVFVQLQLHDAGGKLVSRNFYWVAHEPADLRKLGDLPQVGLDVQARREAGGMRVSVRNDSTHVALGTRLTVVDAQGQRVLPAYYSGNYLNLAPGETREVTITGDTATALDGAANLKMRGWNVRAQSVPLGTSDTVPPAPPTSRQ
ncbi:glycosyl hydrolase 2 galactose-binding domain-containing protein [Rhodanobacter caeni]|uniref:Glycoside hydrolase family 2 n=1 Tax=Rhodanobacter caeni TaxID=657654 RepID=A0ABP3EIJ3_9GAMM